MICDTSFYTKDYVSGYINPYYTKYNHCCVNYTRQFSRTAVVANQNYFSVDFNVNRHKHQAKLLIKVGIRCETCSTCLFVFSPQVFEVV